MQYKQIIYSVRYCKICTMHNRIIDRSHDKMLLLCTTLFASKKRMYIYNAKKRLIKWHIIKKYRADIERK